MKGLFVKDLLVLRRYIRTMAVFVLVYILVFTLIDSADVISGMVPLVLAMMSMAACWARPSPWCSAWGSAICARPGTRRSSC